MGYRQRQCPHRDQELLPRTRANRCSEFPIDCLVFSLASMSLGEKIAESTNLRMNPLVEGGDDVIITEEKTNNK